jgi:DNA polymerase-1
MAPPGWSLIEIDYSQAELVLLAFLSKDPGFMEAVMSTDLHTMTAKQLMKSDTVDDNVRRKAKTINFLKAYGGGAKLLAERLGISEEEAQQWLHKWDVTYPLVPAYNLEQQRKWKADKVITGLYGRKKRFPPVFDRDNLLKLGPRWHSGNVTYDRVGSECLPGLAESASKFSKLFHHSCLNSGGYPGTLKVKF